MQFMHRAKRFPMSLPIWNKKDFVQYEKIVISLQKAVHWLYIFVCQWSKKFL